MINKEQGKTARQYKQERLASRTEADIRFSEILKSLNRHFSEKQVFHNGNGIYYIVDFFVAWPYKTIFEIDGKYHLQNSVIDRDVKKTLFLECDRGYRVFRFPNDDVLNYPHNTRNKVMQILKENKFHWKHSSFLAHCSAR